MTENGWADTILVAHTMYVAIVVLAVPLIAIGGWLRWRWVHAIWFRTTHLLMIAIVVAESYLGIRCPLTVWEQALRPAAQAAPDRDFIAAHLDRIMFYHFPAWVFTAAYTLFGGLIVGLLFVVPPRRNAAKGRHIAPDQP